MAPSMKPVRPAVSAGKGNIMPPTWAVQASKTNTPATFTRPVRPVPRSAGKGMLSPPNWAKTPESPKPFTSTEVPAQPTVFVRPVRPAVSAGKGNIMPPTWAVPTFTAVAPATFTRLVRPVPRSAEKGVLSPPKSTTTPESPRPSKSEEMPVQSIVFTRPVRPVPRSAGKGMLLPPTENNETDNVAKPAQDRTLQIKEEASEEPSQPRLLMKIKKRDWKAAKKAVKKEKTKQSKLKGVAKNKVQKKTRRSKA
ncbi:unnamed protein product [Bursaphelenchus okinawaensis]|uniref:Uncharacterized protein n=1 Tax=Bursaphelenchus okinawaensis TaxID=465554 RepID=A0A811LD39_9BILA|nr:unnamed protein product [Bursaphelenchus okinawaensis]CAG9121705.1 unnamed protein product [Bursaphelenchus okinawaensis]